MGFSLIGILVLVGVPMLLWLSIRSLWMSLTLPASIRGGPRCGGCGYSVADLSSFTCPECGKDLREAGITSPSTEARRRGSTGGAILAWFFLWLLAANIALGVLSEFGLFTSRTGGPTTTTTLTLDVTPISRAYRGISVETTWDDDLFESAVTLTLTKSDGAAAELAIEPDTWTTDDIATWFESEGLDVEQEDIAAEAAELATHVDDVLADPELSRGTAFVAFRSTRLSSSQTTVGGFGFQQHIGRLIGVLSGLILVFALGVVLIVRRRRTMLAPPRTAQSG